MFGLNAVVGGGDFPAEVVQALDKSLAIIEFDTSGNILRANANFCAAMDYEFAEIKGRHHSMFVDPEYVRSPDYALFWQRLSRGEFDAREYRRIGKNGKDVWIQASYNPVVNSKGAVIKVVKVATDITAEKQKNAEFEAKFTAISRAQAVIEFTPAGEVLTANQNFLDTLGYRLEEIKGQHHRLFVEPAYAQSAQYREFWETLNRGEYLAAEYRRFGKGGKEVWIQASYNPVFDLKGRVMKVVKFATDITGRVRAVNEVGSALARLAENDLAQRISGAFSPEFEKLRSDFNAALGQLQTTMREITQGAQVIQSGASEVALAVDDLAHRTEQQAASLEETAAAVEEITATVKKAAEGASHAQRIASAADDGARAASKVVQSAIENMDAIAASAQQISQISGVIDEIAFQTNLLALNAGVEAARAGDAGRGFAVVASEVRALAQRSAEAAKEIKTLIAKSSDIVESGVQSVGDTGQALDRIVAQVSEIAQLVTGIAAGATQQSVALQEVNVAVAGMDRMTQQNAAMVEESTAAAQSLSNETTRVAEIVGQFDIGETARPALKASAPTPKASTPTRTDSAAPRPAPRKVANGGVSDWQEF
ncbi:MAG: PAS domain-containing protein [Caulobacterales bacterium]|nr:PAS domain-containing protein [Caulobacterales bacterium]